MLNETQRHTTQRLVFPTCRGVASCMPWSDAELVIAPNLHRASSGFAFHFWMRRSILRRRRLFNTVESEGSSAQVSLVRPQAIAPRILCKHSLNIQR